MSSPQASEVAEAGPLRPPPRIRPPPALVTAVGVGALLATVYPLLVARALAAWGVRPVASTLLASGVAALGLWRLLDRDGRAPVAVRALPLALPLWAALSGDALPLRLVPPVIQLGLAALFLISLRGGGSVFYDAARALHPYAPDFIAPYCRKSTAVFAGVLALQGAAATWLAFDPPQSWSFASGIAIWTPLCVASAIDWIVRKWWFRYYGPGPLDQLLRRLLPPENTATGRRSLEYIRRMRAQLGMPPP